MITGADFIPQGAYLPRSAIENGELHKAIIQQALKENKPVPKKVLEDYPDLAKKYKKEIPKAETEWQPVEDYTKITEGTHVKWRYRGKEGEGIVTGKTGKTKTGFVYQKVKTPEGKTKYIPWTPKAEYWVKIEKKVKPVKEAKAEVKEKEPIIAIAKDRPNVQYEVERFEDKHFISKRAVILSNEGKILEIPGAEFEKGSKYPKENFRFVTPKEYMTEIKAEEAKIKAKEEAQRKAEQKKQEKIKQILKAKPITDKYYIYIENKGFKEVEKVIPVKIPGFEKYDLFAHKEGRKWRISEGKTGLSVTGCFLTREEAIEKAIENLNKYKDKLDKAITNAIDEVGLSPRYKPILKEEAGIDRNKIITELVNRGFTEKQLSKASDDTLKQIKTQNLTPEQVSILQDGGLKIITPEKSKESEIATELSIGLSDPKIYIENYKKIGSLIAKTAKNIADRMTSGLLKKERDAFLEKFRKKKDIKELKFIDRIWHVPQSLARKYPKIKKALETSLKRRNDRILINNKFHKYVEPYFDLKNTSRVDDVLWKGDTEERVYTETELKEMGLNDAEIKAYFGVRKALDKAFVLYRNTLKKLFPNDKKLLVDFDAVYHKGYMPHVRKGKYYVVAKKDGKVIYTTGAKNKNEVEKIIKQLKETYELDDSNIEWNKSRPAYSEETYQLLSREATIKLLDDLLTRHGTNIPESDLQKLKLALTKELNTVIKARAFRRHFIRRKGTPGYSTEDTGSIILDYLHGNAGFVTKVRAAKRYMDILESVSDETPRLKSYLRSYINEQLRNTTEIDKITGIIQTALFTKFIGFSPKQFLLNVTQNITIGIPRLVQEGFSELKAISGLTKASKDIATKNLTETEKRMLTKAEMRGELSAFMTKELSTSSTHLQDAWQKFSEVNSFFMAQSERFNRRLMFLTSFRLLKKKGLSDNEAYKKAIEITNDTHFIYGKLNRPELLSGGTWKEGALRSVATFQTWGLNYLNFLYDAASMYRGGRVIFDSLLALGVLGGLFSVPTYTGYKWLYKKLKGKPTPDELWLARNPSALKRLLRTGILGAFGVDLSGSLSTSFTAGGPPYSAYKTIQEGMEAIKRGDYTKLIGALSPKGLENVLSAYKQYQGLQTKYGQPMLKLTKEGKIEQIKLSLTGAIIRAFGFYPAGLSQDMFLRYTVKSVEHYFREKQINLATRIRKAHQKGDIIKRNKLIKDYVNLAKQARKYGINMGAPTLIRLDKQGLRMQKQMIYPEK